MIKKTITTLALFIFFISNAQERNPFYIGHSLVNEDMPLMVQALATDAEKTTHHGKQIINGATLAYNWDHHATAQGTSYQAAFPEGNYNTLVITEAVPLQNHLTWSNTLAKANDFYNYAKNNNSGIPIRFYIYETWHCKNSGIPQPGLATGCSYDETANSNTLWHPRLQLDFSLWSGIVDHVRNQNSTDNEIWMVPAGQAFYNLTTEINEGNVAGINSVFDLFSDDIHMTNAGNYFVACVMYATIYRQSPVGLTTSIANQWGTPFTNMPTPAQALVMQQVAWNTVTNLNAWTGVTTSTSPEEPTNTEPTDAAPPTDTEPTDTNTETTSTESTNTEPTDTDTEPTSTETTSTESTDTADTAVTDSEATVLEQEMEVKEEKISIYPNPGTDYITIDGNEAIEIGNLQIYTSTGAFVKKVTANNRSVNIADLQIGLYFIRLENNPTQVFKFLKK